MDEVKEIEGGKDDSKVWINLMFLFSVAFICAGASRLAYAVLLTPSASFGSPFSLLSLLLYIVFIVIGCVFIVGMVRGRRWVLSLAMSLFAVWIILQCSTLFFPPVNWMVFGINLLFSIAVCGLITVVLTRPSMKAFFST